MTAESDIAAIDDGGANTAAEVRTAMTSILGAVPQWMRYLNERQSDETSHVDDDFFDDATKTGITETTPTGTATWTEKYGLLSVLYDSVAATDAAVALKALTPSSAPVTVETAMTMERHNVNYRIAGVILTDGTTAASNSVALSIWGQSFAGIRYQSGTITNWDAVNTQIVPWAVEPLAGRIYLRLIWTASNTFEIAYSTDGVSWTKAGASDISKTMTPTHFGVFVSNYGNTTPAMASFDYLRVNESDLSV